MDWKELSLQLRFDEHKKFSEIAKEVQRRYFPDDDQTKVYERIRSYIRRIPQQSKGNITYEDKREVREADIREYYNSLKKTTEAIKNIDGKQLNANIHIDSHKPIGVAFWGDWHFGARGVAYEQHDLDSKIIRSIDRMYYIGMGDYKDNSNPNVIPTTAFETVAPKTMQDEIVRMKLEETSDKAIALTRGCFLPGTLITMKDGTVKPIESIVPGDYVISGYGNNKQVANKYLNEYDGEVCCVNAFGVCENIHATSDHKMLAIKNSDLINRVDPTWVEIGNLEKGDYLVIPKGKHSSIVKYSDDLLWAIGLFLAEGHYLKPTAISKKYGIGITLGITESNLADRFVRIIEDEFKKTCTVRYRENKNTIDIACYGSDIADYFFVRCGEYSHSKVLSDEMFNLSNADYIVAGFIDGDAHQGGPHNATTITTISKQLAYQMKSILIRNGIPCIMRQQNRKNRIYNDYQICIRSVFANKLSSKCNRIDISYPKSFINKYVVDYNDKYIVCRIRSIDRYKYSGYVHNFEVEDDHCYIAGGVSAKNCHEDHDYKASGIDIVGEWCKEISAVNLWHGGFINLTVGDEEYRIAARHKYRGDSGVNTTNSQRLLISEFGHCDVVALGHKHYSEIQHTTKQGEDSIFVRSGTYKLYDEFGQKIGGYTGGYGVPVVIFFPDKHMMLPVRDLELAAEILENY